MATILKLQNIVKIYPNGVIANKGVSLDIEENNIHAIVGENGAGKTTLMKILFGMETLQEGKIFYRGEEVSINSSHDAIKMGIGMVHQHFMLAPDLTVAENMILGIEPLKGSVFLDKNKSREITASIAKEFGLTVPPEKKVKYLPIGVRQRIEILKALYRNAELLILDEPTAVLTPQETEVLFSTLKKLKHSGKTIIFISHKLKEVKQIADKVTIMRDGNIITTADTEKLTEHDIAYLMVGRDISFDRIPVTTKTGPPIMSVKDLSYTNEDNVEVLKKISFEVRTGEILGLVGVEGNGQTELVEVITGLRKPTGGSVFINDEEITGASPRMVREKSIAHIPEDRIKNGVAEETSVKENLIIDKYYKKGFSKNLRLKWDFIGNYGNKLIKDFQILTSSPDEQVSSLSGGNIQKLVVARELSSAPRIIIAVQPTRGIDIGSEEMVHGLLNQARNSGLAILLVSADLDELLKMSSRLIVIYSGEIVAEFDNVEELQSDMLGPYMLGIKRQEV